MPDPPVVTVVLPTYRRPDSLARALRGLAAQVDPGVGWDVVVVDNDPDQGAAATVEVEMAGTNLSWRLLHQPRVGSAHARNLGIEQASGSIIALLDDDVVPDPDWLARIVAPILAGTCDGTGGTIRLDPTVARPAWFDEPGIGGYLAAFTPDARTLGSADFVLTANAAFRTEPLRATGGFSDMLGPRGSTPLVCDDNLLTRRFMATGATMRYVPEAIVTHELAPTRLNRRYLLKRSWAQGRSDWILDREAYEARKLNGLRVALHWLGRELQRRRTEGLRHPGMAFHAATDLARTAGSVREMVMWSLEGTTARANYDRRPMTRDADRMREYWDEAARKNAAFYVDTDVSYDDPDMEQFWATGRTIVEHAYVNAAVKPEGNALAVEIGSGLGRNCKVLGEHFEQVVGIDIAPSMVEQATELVTMPNVRFVVGDGDGLSAIETESADYVLSFTVFQHMVSLSLITANMHDAARVLRPGGVFAFQWNNEPGEKAWQARRSARALLHKVGIGKERYKRDQPEFLGTKVTFETITEICAEGGLTIEHTEGLGTLFAWAWARKR
jgi:glycosyltransferase involved in cell wall biosynthesis/SAM-dependent methyltransferase